MNVTLADDSAAGVAFQLAKQIAAYETAGGLEQKRVLARPIRRLLESDPRS